jgi:hypothetical protein
MNVSTETESSKITWNISPEWNAWTNILGYPRLQGNLPNLETGLIPSARNELLNDYAKVMKSNE